MKRIAVFAAACAIALPIYAQTVATVHGQSISQEKLDQFVALLLAQGAQDTPALRTQVKQDMVNRLVAVQAAEHAGIDKQADVKKDTQLARQVLMVSAMAGQTTKK